jgi:FtsH-binding integral membrane protein
MGGLEMNLTAFGGRRFLLTMGCGIACTALVWFAKIDASTFRDIIIATVGVYIAGNTYQAVKNGAKTA